MKYARRNSTILLFSGILLVFIALVAHIPEILICAAIFCCTSVVIDSLVLIKESEDTKES